MLVDSLLVAVGLATLIWGADRFVLGAAGAARLLRVAPLLIGLVLVGFATSAPELLISVSAALRDSTGLAVGNAVGSNTANVGLVLGATLLIRPMALGGRGLNHQLWLMLGATVLGCALLLDASLERVDGLLLLGALVLVLALVVRTALRHPTAPEALQPVPPQRTPGARAAALWLVLGLAALLAGAQLTVVAAESLAGSLGVSGLVIGLTVVAIGTSLPELAVSVVGAIRGEHELALGNIIGSNVFNLLGVVGLAAALRPAAVDTEVVTLHLPVMGALTVALFLMAYNWAGLRRVGRLQAALLLLAFTGYHGYIIHTH